MSVRTHIVAEVPFGRVAEAELYLRHLAPGVTPAPVQRPGTGVTFLEAVLPVDCVKETEATLGNINTHGITFTVSTTT
ncbi:hypothetical protein [Streptacidiphilus sp. MAP5-3]|uniref:hypothetical protein n=1 Tax=unclassified Streptacidiphilus TaxID=2643834 RepID=UPI0035193268